MNKIRYLIVRWTDVRLEPRDIPKLRGFFAHKYPSLPLFHNHLPDEGYDYKAPRIQYRVIERHPALVAFGEGIELVKQAFLEVDELVINGRAITSNEREISLREADFGQCAAYHHYYFSSPWMALNKDNYRIYRDLDDFQRKQLLKRILKSNLKTISKGFEYTIPNLDDIHTDGWFQPLKVNYHNQPMQCFSGEFTTNFLIPDHLGLGGKVSRGFGVVKTKKEEER